MNTAAVVSTLIDITKCIGCRACQVACKHQERSRGGGDGTRMEPGSSEPCHSQRQDPDLDHVS